jgi:SPP1 family predicted phage head-tail adaptor
VDIAGLRVRITVQKNETVTDKYGNHKDVWTDYFSCWATASAGGRSSETNLAASTQEADLLDFTVRYCPEAAQVTSKTCRILLEGKIYDITSIDEMGFKRNSRKFHCELKER